MKCSYLKDDFCKKDGTPCEYAIRHSWELCDKEELEILLNLIRAADDLMKRQNVYKDIELIKDVILAHRKINKAIVTYIEKRRKEG